MTEEQIEFMTRTRKSIDKHFSHGNHQLASRLSKILRHLPHNFSGAIASAIEGHMDSYLIDELKSTFGV
jgi:hypothetical protein